MQHPEQRTVDAVVAASARMCCRATSQDFGGCVCPHELARLPVLRAGHSRRSSYPPRLLFEGAHSGTGESADWQQAAALARVSELILAGGLHAGNVARRDRAVRPVRRRVSSGVELRPGIKDAQQDPGILARPRARRSRKSAPMSAIQHPAEQRAQLLRAT